MSIAYYRAKQFSVIGVYIFLATIFFFKIPNFYIIPFWKNPIATTQGVGRIALVILFTMFLCAHFLKKPRQKLFGHPQTFFTAVLVVSLFTLKSLSIVSAVNINSFLNNYKDQLVGVLAFFVFYFYRKEYKKIFLILLVSFVINTIYQLILFLRIESVIVFLQNAIYQKHFQFVDLNLNRNRIYTDTYDEIILPFLFIAPQIQKQYSNIVRHVLIVVVSFLTLVSNFRSRLLMLLVGIVLSLFSFKKNKVLNIKKTILLFFIIVAVAGVADKIVLQKAGFSLYERITLQSKEEDVDPIMDRIEQVKLASTMGASSFFGVGLGNYYEHLPTLYKYPKSIFEWRNIEFTGANESVHNMLGATLAEAGYLSFAIFLILLGYFAYGDIIMLKTTSTNQYYKGFIIAFWILTSYGLLNPAPASYQVLFWGIRGLLLP